MINELNAPFDNGMILQNKRRIKRKLLENGNDFIEKKIAILSGSTIGEMADILEIFLLNNNIKPIFWKGNYNRFYEDSVFNNASLLDFNPDIVYIHTSCKNIRSYPEFGDSGDSVSNMLNNEIRQYIEMWEVLLEKTNAAIIQNNFEMLPYRAFGNSEVYRQDGSLNYINLLNDRIYNYATHHNNFYVNDIAYQASQFGLKNWFDNAMWYAYKYPFSLEAIPLVAFNISNIIKSILGKNKRSLVLDLDNTLWGGVIGDCGADNISLGNETPEGMAFSDFQKYIKRIHGSGVNLSICSKNYESTAMEGFSHSGSVLKSGDFICKYINWENKDENIKKISSLLNTSFENIVFIDDNPVERELVKQSIPELNVPEMSNPENYINIFDSLGYFEITNTSSDDLKRNDYYRTDLKRMNEMRKYASYEEYLLSLEMECHILKINEDNIERVTQLINKTNQFNFTTKHYTMNEVKSLVEDENNITFCVSLKDKFGDNGIVSVLFAFVEGDRAVIDLWIMSCRVFNRNLEFVVFSELINKCNKMGIKYIEGLYLPTAKNKYVENLYPDLGFEKIEEDDNKSVWELDLQHPFNGGTFSMEVFYDE